MTKFKEMRKILVWRLELLSITARNNAKAIKELDLDSPDIAESLNYLGGLVEEDAVEADKAMDDIYDLANKIETYKEQFDPDAMTSIEENQSLGF